MKRRTLVMGTLAGSAAALAASAGVFIPGTTLASVYPRNAFQATDETQVLLDLFGTADATPVDTVTIETPLQAMYGKGVPVTVRCATDEVELIAVVTRNNRYPLNTFVRLHGAVGYYTTRIRLERSSVVSAYVSAGNALYFSSAAIKLSHGGYGTHLE